MGLMAGFPHIQRRLQDEVDSTIGQREPSLSDKENMPFVEATIFELLRFADPVWMNLPHISNSDQTVGGHHVPKGTTVSMPFFFCHYVIMCNYYSKSHNGLPYIYNFIYKLYA